MSNINDVRGQIDEVRTLGEKYGKLVQGRTLTFLEVAEIISYYEEDGETIALLEADEKIEELKLKLQKTQGSVGGMTRRINKLELDNKLLANVQENNKRLGRVSSYAHEMLEYLDKPSNVHIDVKGEKLTELPLYVRLREELGLGE